MDTNKNTYTVIYATILVVLVASILSIVSLSLKERQQRNIDTETEQNILFSVNLAEGADKAKNRGKLIKELYEKYITESYLVNSEGERIQGDAFRLSLKSQYDIMKQSSPDVSKLTLPVFVCTTGNKERVEIFPVYGAGLWGPIWGYISLESDFNTIYGAVFCHEKETPGLGAEIATDKFRMQFRGKKIFEGGAFTSVTIQKGGADPGDIHAVDAISGGSITSESLQNTIETWFKHYMPYIKKQLAARRINSDKEENHEQGDF